MKYALTLSAALLVAPFTTIAAVAMNPIECVQVSEGGELKYTDNGATNVSTTSDLTISCPIPNNTAEDLRAVDFWVQPRSGLVCSLVKKEWEYFGTAPRISRASSTVSHSSTVVERSIRASSVGTPAQDFSTVYSLECLLPAGSSTRQASLVLYMYE